MAIRYALDLYPRANPLGARVTRFGDLQDAGYYGARNGMGHGWFAMRGDSSDAGFVDPDGLQYVKVVRYDTAIVDAGTLSGFSELVVGGFFTSRGKYLALTESNTKLLTWEGPGPLSYYGRAVMDADSWLNDPFIGTDPQPDGTWPLHLAGTGNELGAILWRVLHEVEEPGRHQNPLAAMTLGFTHLVDSNGAPWVRTTGDFVAQVGDNVLQIIKRLMEMGLYVKVNPDTLRIDAYEPETHQRTRTGAAWGASVVRFQYPSTGTVATGNIKSDLVRNLDAKVRRNAILVGSHDTWQWVSDAAVTVLWEGSYIVDDDDGTSLLKIGEAQLGLRSDAGDVLRLRMDLGNDPANGFYKPFETAGVLLDDRVTVHTGTGQYDLNEQTFPVAALEVRMRRDKSGEWDAFAELGASFTSMSERDFQSSMAVVGNHRHPPNPQLCRPLTTTEPIPVRTAGSASGTVGGFTVATGDVLYAFLSTPAEFPVTLCRWSIGPQAFTLIESTVNGGSRQELWRLLTPTAGAGQVEASNGTGSIPLIVTQARGRTSGSTDTVAEATGSSATSGVTLAIGTGQMRIDGASHHKLGGGDPPGSAVPTPGAGQTLGASLAVEAGDVEFGVSTGGSDAEANWTFTGSLTWVAQAIILNGTAGGGDGHADLIGTSARAKRCDDTEHYHATADPTVNDDTTLGFRNKTLWFNESGGKVKTWLLKNNADGAAVWLLVASTSHADLADLGTGDPHTQYQKESEKGVASGYASLDGTTKVPTAQLGSGTADATTFLRGDRTWAASAVTAAQVRDAGRWEPVIDADGSLVLDGATPPDVVMSWEA